MPVERVGLLSPGAMGSVVARVLIDGGLPVATCLDGRGPGTATRTREAGIDTVSSYNDLVSGVDVLLSILVPSEALAAAHRTAEALQHTGSSLCYVDCNAIAPETAHSLDEVITSAGGRFVDAGIIGPPPTREGVTRFYASGEHVAEFEALGSHGLDIRSLGAGIGKASGFKMCYASQTKGRSAIFIQSLVAAQRLGIIEPLIQELQKSQARTYADSESGLPRVPSKAGRWIGEMEEIARTFGGLGMTPLMFDGAADVYRFVHGAGIDDADSQSADGAAALRNFLELLSDHLPGDAPGGN